MSSLATTKTYNANNTVGGQGLFTRWTVLAQRRRINASDYTWSSVERDLDFGEVPYLHLSPTAACVKRLALTHAG